jgi:hypothetical protein
MVDAVLQKMEVNHAVKNKIMKKIIQTITFGLVVFGGLMMTVSVQAIPSNATITWGIGAQNISSDNDVSTSGTLVNAFNLGPAGVTATTINGVLFGAFAFPANFSVSTATLGNYNFTESSGALTSYNNLGSGSLPASSLSSAYQALLFSAGSSDNNLTLTLTMSGLTVGQNYLFQCWVNDSSMANSLNGQAFSTTATAGNSVFINNNTTAANGGVGQFATGTFTASGTTEAIGFNGAGFNDPLLDGFQLRAIPEPSISALMGIGVLTLVLKLRPRRSF